jgi:hypothetical protein
MRLASSSARRQPPRGSTVSTTCATPQPLLREAWQRERLAVAQAPRGCRAENSQGMRPAALSKAWTALRASRCCSSLSSRLSRQTSRHMACLAGTALRKSSTSSSLTTTLRTLLRGFRIIPTFNRSSVRLRCLAVQAQTLNAFAHEGSEGEFVLHHRIRPDDACLAHRSHTSITDQRLDLFGTVEAFGCKGQ